MTLTAVFVVWMLYGVPSMFFSMAALYCVCMWKEFDSPFYRLVTMNLVINIFVYLHTWIKRILSDDDLSNIFIPVFINAKLLLQANDFCSQWGYHLQSCNLLVKFAYCYHIVTKFKAMSSWRKNWFWIYVVVIFCTLAYTLRWGSWSWVMNVQCGVYILVTVVVEIITRRGLKNEHTSSKSAKKRITAMIVIDTVLHCAVWTWHFLPDFIDMSRNDRIAMLFFVSDMISCTTPYTLFFVDPLFRHTVLRCVFKWKSNPEVQPVGMPPTRAPSALETRF